MKNTKGITLIALVVTIILLLILTGITIAQFTENGLLEKAKDAKEGTVKAQIKEEIQMAIMEIQMEEIEKGKKVTLETLANNNREELMKKLEEITIEWNNNEITGEYKGYEYKIDENLKVTIGERIKGISFHYKLNPNGYTNQEVTLTINATSSNGKITNIQCSNSNVTKRDDVTFTITKNGSYEFVVEDLIGETKTKIIDIKIIDKVEPLDFSISKKITENNKIKLIVDAEDGEENEESVKSGIEKYEYYINGTKYESQEANYILNNENNSNRYEVYVIVYDKAGNTKKSTNTLKIGRTIFVANEGNTLGQDGSISKPYTDIQNAVNISQDGDIIKILAGEYTLTPTFIPNTNDQISVGLLADGKDITICGENANTIIRYNAKDSGAGWRRPAIMLGENAVLKNVYFEFTPVAPDSWGGPNVGIFFSCSGKVNNVFFRVVGPNTGAYLYGGTAKFEIRNCTFFHNKDEILPNWDAQAFYYDIATNVTPPERPAGANKNVITQNFGNANMSIKELIEASKENEQFKQKQVGIYYGIDAWDS